MILIVILFLVLPVIAGAEDGTGRNPGGSTGRDPITLDNPLGEDVNSLSKFVEIILNKIVLPIGSVVVVLFIIYTGFLFVTARGNPEKIESAKRTLLWVVIGTAILLGSVVISAAIQGTLCDIASNLPECSSAQSPAPPDWGIR